MNAMTFKDSAPDFWRGRPFLYLYVVLDVALMVGMIWNMITANWLAVIAYALVSCAQELGLIKHMTR